ncbi:MAG: peptidoglycan DD-metalloendopeptidase family protein, partial [Bacteroidales bacterium]|nr:peptidoglycan DD-metalloendopeptidase family protein [Bacteroidales bacterium]
INDYFDEQGNSLRREFLKAPLQFRRISSHFSNNRFHPILRRYRPHHGVDYAAASGTPVVSIGDGKVTIAGRKGRAGNMVKIRHNSVYTTTYMHLRSYGEGIRQGASVKQGQVIGFVGSTGLSTGPHLDFRVQKNGQYINPLTLESPPALPIPKHQKEDYLRTIAPWRSALDNIGNITNKTKQYLTTRLPIASFSQQHIIAPISNNGP